MYAAQTSFNFAPTSNVYYIIYYLHTLGDEGVFLVSFCMPEVFRFLLCSRREYFSSLENWKKTLRINNISSSFSFHRKEHISGLGIKQNTLWAMGKIFPPLKWGFPCSET
jgi:hypothetical protein